MKQYNVQCNANLVKASLTTAEQVKDFHYRGFDLELWPWLLKSQQWHLSQMLNIRAVFHEKSDLYIARNLFRRHVINQISTTFSNYKAPLEQKVPRCA